MQHQFATITMSADLATIYGELKNPQHMAFYESCQYDKHYYHFIREGANLNIYEVRIRMSGFLTFS